MKVRIAGIAEESVTDGPGLRTTLFFQGCPHHCPGCHNPQTWDPEGGQEHEIGQLLAGLKVTPLISGFTFSGGEPFYQAKAAAEIAATVKASRLNLWVYTGYRWEDLIQKTDQPGYRELLDCADVIVDGPFRKDLLSLSLPFRGSQNQRIIRVKPSLERGEIIEWVP